MRIRIGFVSLFLMALFVVNSVMVTPAAFAQEDSTGVDIGRETLAPNDGWAAFSTGTTGGSQADSAHVFVVTNRQQLVTALNNGDPTPKIIYINDTIDVNVDDNNQPLSCADYALNGYTLEAYLAAYDPAVWGRTSRPSGALENARVASQRNQQARMKLKVGSNTTIVGVKKEGRLRGVNLDVNAADNVIIRNIYFEDAYDCFPQWDPTDGSLGNWNSQYDSISLFTATHVWVDHCEFNDGDNPDSAQPIYFGRPYQVHDGALDITRGSDFVTVSWNRFKEHDKVMLIGSTDNPGTPGSVTSDRGKLRVTVHHNLFDNVGQRLPRVRFGQVHIYNNYYKVYNPDVFQYGWGVGFESQIYAQNNFIRTDKSISIDKFIRRFNGTAIFAAGTYLNGTPSKNQIDILAAYNAVNDPDLAGTVGWTPTLFTEVLPTSSVPSPVQNKAGPFMGSDLPPAPTPVPSVPTNTPSAP